MIVRRFLLPSLMVLLGQTVLVAGVATAIGRLGRASHLQPRIYYPPG
jgi:hypothetical protein